MADIDVTTLDTPSSMEEVEASNMVFFDPITGVAKRLPTFAVLNPFAPALTEAVDPASTGIAYIVQDDTTGEWYKVLGSDLPSGGGGGWITKENLADKIAQGALTNPDGSVYYQEAGVGAVWFPRIRIPIISATDDPFVTCRNFYHNELSGWSDPETSFSIYDDWILLNTSAVATEGSEVSLSADQPRAKPYQANLLPGTTDSVFTFGGITPNVELAIANFAFYFPDGSFVANTATHAIYASVDICGISFYLAIDFAEYGNNNWFFGNDIGSYDLGITAPSIGSAPFRIEMDSVAEEVRVYQGSAFVPLLVQPFSNMGIMGDYGCAMRAALYLTGDATAEVSFGVSQFGVIMTAV